MRIVFDLDGTLCEGYPYENAKPIEGAAELLRDLRAAGHTIIIHTARGMGRSHGNVAQAIAAVGHLTLQQLIQWDFEHDELLFGKPGADVYVDDKGLRAAPTGELRLSLLGGHDERTRHMERVECTCSRSA